MVRAPRSPIRWDVSRWTAYVLCEPKVYRDNLLFSGSLSEFSQSTSPHDIMGIEVYSTATEPPQFQGSCGVIVVWTRTGV